MPKVSIFNSVSDVTNPRNLELEDYLEKTRDGEWAKIVAECRAIVDKDERDAFKRTMPTTTLSGEFTTRSNDGLVIHSEYLNIDLDDVENIIQVKKALEKDKYVYSVFRSTSGTGLRVIFKIEPNRHADAFKAISSYLWNIYSQVSDHNGIALSKPYVVSDDATLYLNPDSVPVFKRYIKETQIKKMNDFVHTSGDFDSIIKQIVGRGINICEDYQDWLKVGFAISSQFGEDGRNYFHEVSRQSSKYKYESANKQYTYCVRARGIEKANISTFYYLAKINNVNISSEQTRIIVRTTKNGKRAGLDKKAIAETLKNNADIEGAEKLIESLYENNDSSSFEENEESIIHQLEMFISANYPHLKMNEVTGYLEQYGDILSQSYLNTMFIAAKKICPKLDYALMIRLLKSDFVKIYNPFFEFFGSDGIAVELPPMPDEFPPKYESPIIDALAKSIENDDPGFTKYFLRKWIVSIVSSAHKVHSPLLLCLLGKQLTGKTEFFRRLLPKELMGYYAESKLDKEKDDELLMCENLIIMDDELGGKSKQDAQKLKNITSKQYFSLRRPYGDHNEKILRLAVLCGTSNSNEIMSDPTGNRRIIPIEVKNIQKVLYNSIDKKELFLEAFRLYKEGFDWRVNSKDMSYLNKDVSKYEAVIKEKELIERYFIPADEGCKNEIRMSTTDVLVELYNLTHQKLNVKTIGGELDRLGYKRKTTRLNAFSTPKLWCMERINRSEVINRQKDEDLPF
jgi:hypothetical protein